MQLLLCLLILVPSPKEPPNLIGQWEVEWGSLKYACEFSRDGSYDSDAPWLDGTWKRTGDTFEFHDTHGAWTIHITNWQELTGEGRRFYGPDDPPQTACKVKLKRK